MKNSLDPKFKFWLTISIIVAVLFSLSGLKLAFETPYTVQDDARQHVFWLQRLNDAELFPNDLIANYFSSVAPIGYKFLYWLANLFGLDPFLFNKILPVFIGTGSSIYMFLVTVEIFPVPFAGFLSSLLLNQNLWLINDVVSGTPRAFFYIFFLGFIYYLLRQQLLFCLLFIVLQGGFYPQAVLISAGIALLKLITNKQKWYFYLICLTLAIAILAIYKLQTSEFDRVMTLEIARQLPEFYPGGRSSFFSNRWWDFWLVGERSGFFPYEWEYVLLSSFGLLLPFIIIHPERFKLAKYINYRVEIIGQILLVSFCLFCLAHLFLFKLHLPSRYSQHTWRIAIALTNGIVLTIFLKWLSDRVDKNKKNLQRLIVAVAILVILLPTYIVQNSYPYRFSYATGEAPELYQFLQQQPKDSLIATLSKEGDFIPSLAQRSVLTSREYSIPYHWDYYRQIRQRTKDLIQAQYSDSQADITQFVQKYQPNFWAIDKNAFEDDYLEGNRWLQQFQPETQNATANIQRDQPLMVDKIDRCRIFETPKLNLLDAQCVANE
jgi:hypothetical protein